MAARFSRRSLLQSAMLMCGAILVPRRAASAAPAVVSGRLGLLLPQSVAGESFLRGLRLALPDQPIAVERVALARTAVAQGARRLLAAANGRLIGLVGPNLSVAVASELKGSGATLLAVDTGANVIRADEESPQVITHSLGLWRGAVALGAWAARQYGPRGLVLSGIVESGYDMLHAFEIGLTEAEGHLGYEAGLLAAAEQQGIDGPRGWIRPGPLGATRFPLYLRKVVGQSNQVLGAVPAPAENAPAMAALRSAVRTGWVTPYLV